MEEGWLRRASGRHLGPASLASPCIAQVLYRPFTTNVGLAQKILPPAAENLLAGSPNWRGPLGTDGGKI